MTEISGSWLAPSGVPQLTVVTSNVTVRHFVAYSYAVTFMWVMDYAPITLATSLCHKNPDSHTNWLSSSCYLQEVGLVCQWNGLSQGDIEGVRWNATQEGHGVRAPEERVVLTRFCWNWVLILVLQSWTWGETNNCQHTTKDSLILHLHTNIHYTHSQTHTTYKKEIKHLFHIRLLF